MNENKDENKDEVVVEAPSVPEPTPNTEPATGGIDAQAEHDEVEAALAREDDGHGPGFDDESELPAEDFQGFASDDV